MSKTTTKPKPGSIEAHRGREAEALAAGAAARTAADAAAASIPERELAVESAEEHVEDIRAAWAQGLDTYAADDLTRAMAEVERCTALLAGARATIAREERKALADDTDVAQIVASAITDVADWLPCVPTVLAPAIAADAETAAYVVQTKPTKRTGLGVLSGTVDLAVSLDRRFRPLTLEALAEALHARGQVADVIPTSGGVGVRLGESEWSHYRVTVRQGRDEVPVITMVPTDATAEAFGRTVVAESGHAGLSASVRRATAEVEEVGGVRTTRVRALLVGHVASTSAGYDRYAAGSSDWDFGPGRPAPLFSRLTETEGRFVEGLGLLESFSATPDPSAGGQYQQGWDITAEFTARTSAA